jgi:hypothetical protein
MPSCSQKTGLLHGGKTSFGMLNLMGRVRPVLPSPLAFTGFRFPREVIVLAVRWYLRYGQMHSAIDSPELVSFAAQKPRGRSLDVRFTAVPRCLQDLPPEFRAWQGRRSP